MMDAHKQTLLIFEGLVKGWLIPMGRQKLVSVGGGYLRKPTIMVSSIHTITSIRCCLYSALPTCYRGGIQKTHIWYVLMSIFLDLVFGIKCVCRIMSSFGLTYPKEQLLLLSIRPSITKVYGLSVHSSGFTSLMSLLNICVTSIYQETRFQRFQRERDKIWWRCLKLAPNLKSKNRCGYSREDLLEGRSGLSFR